MVSFTPHPEHVFAPLGFELLFTPCWLFTFSFRLFPCGFVWLLSLHFIPVFFLFVCLIFSLFWMHVHVIESEPGAGSRPGVQWSNKLSAQNQARPAGKKLCVCVYVCAPWRDWSNPLPALSPFITCHCMNCALCLPSCMAFKLLVCF